MKIKSRFLILTTLILLLTGFFSWLSMRVLAEDIIVSWVERYAEKQVLYDKARTLLPLVQEVELSKEFAKLESLKAWAKQPDNVLLKQEARIDAENFRNRFSDKSYFIGLKSNNHYYYSDEQTASHEELYRYTLDASKAADAWFYRLMEVGLNLHLNVNPDIELGVVKLWSDVLIRDGDDILGVVGTGLDLSDFLNQIVEKQDIYSAIVFTNYEGAIQLYQEEDLIDYASITKNSEDKKRIFQLLDDEGSRKILKQSFERARNHPNSVDISSVSKESVRQLASVVYIPEIDWFQINFIDIKNFLPVTEFSSLLFIFLISLICTLIIFYLLFSLIVTRPLAELDSSIRALGKNKYQAPKLSRFAGSEIKRLVADYQDMSKALLEYQHELEDKVEARTTELSRISKLDPLTELYNRRGFEVHMVECMQQWHEQKQPFGLINIDVNKFKAINDLYGHGVGDFVLKKIAAHLVDVVGQKGEVSRWGGDEFLILLKQIDDLDTVKISTILLENKKPLMIKINNQDVLIEFSVGSTLVQEGDTLEDMLHRADKAMYVVKFADR
jgi:diguanylate cyclase (GGDEF)-like protein